MGESELDAHFVVDVACLTLSDGEPLSTTGATCVVREGTLHQPPAIHKHAVAVKVIDMQGGQDSFDARCFRTEVKRMISLATKLDDLSRICHYYGIVALADRQMGIVMKKYKGSLLDKILQNSLPGKKWLGF